MPPELWDVVGAFIANTDRMRLGCTCRALKHLTSDHQLWTQPGARLDCLRDLRVLHAEPHGCGRADAAGAQGAIAMLQLVLRWKCLLHVPHLQELVLRNTHVSDLDMRGVSEFAPQLRVLDLRGSPVTSTLWLYPLLPSLLPLWPQLLELRLGCSAGHYVFGDHKGAGAPVLQHLTVAAADEEAYALDRLPALQTLHCDGTGVLTLTGGEHSQLRHLRATFLRRHMIPMLPPSLRTLSFGVVDAATADAMEAACCAQCPHLTAVQAT